MPDFAAMVHFFKSPCYPVVPFDPARHRLLHLDFTGQNADLTPELLTDTAAFSHYITAQLQTANATYGIGGWNEHRTIYTRSPLFGPRCVHLGIDIWGEAGTPVYAPLPGTVHSVGINNSFGDYGGTLILEHGTGAHRFHTLYGHLNLLPVQALREGETIEGGQHIAAFGLPEENGHWPPHLHFQIIINMAGFKGDYPGVCTLAERGRYLLNCPNPDVLLGMMASAK